MENQPGQMQVPYTTEDIAPKKIILTKYPTYLWNLNETNQSLFSEHPIQSAPGGIVIEVSQIARHALSDTYYLVNDTGYGYRVSDCIDYVEPEPAPVIPPEPPKPYLPPTEPFKVPLNRVKLVLITDVPGYAYMSFAKEAKEPVTQLHPGTYYITRTEQAMQKIDKGDGTPSFWINPADNVEPKPEPVVEPYKPRVGPNTTRFSTYVPYTFPEYFQATKGDAKRDRKAIVFNFAEGKNATNKEIKYGQKLYIAGTFVCDDFLYGRPANLVNNDNGTSDFAVHNDFGILMSNLELVQLDYEPENENNNEEQPPIKEKQLTINDQFTLVKAHGTRFIDGLIKPKKGK